MGIDKYRPHLLVDIVADGESGPVSSQIADIEWLVAFRCRRHLRIVERIHVIFRPGPVKFFHHVGPGIVPYDRILHSEFSLDCSAFLQSGLCQCR